MQKQALYKLYPLPRFTSEAFANLSLFPLVINVAYDLFITYRSNYIEETRIGGF